MPAPRHIIWQSLTQPRRPQARPWLNLLSDEIEPGILAVDEPTRVVWTSLWPSRPDDQVHFELTTVRDAETLLRFTLLTPGRAPDPSKTGHLRRRLNQLLFADLRTSYGQ